MNAQANGLNQCRYLRIQGDAGLIADRFADVEEMVFMIQMYRIKFERYPKCAVGEGRNL